MNLKRITSTAAIAAVGMLISASSARASFQLTITDTSPICVGTCSITITDNGPGDLSNTTNGLITASFNTNDFSTAFTVGSSKPLVGLPNQVDLASLDVTSAGRNTWLQIMLSNTDFTTQTGLEGLLQQVSYTNASDNATVTARGFESNTNNNFALDNSINLVALQHPATGQISTGGPFNFTSPYSLTEVLTLTFGSNATAGNSSEITGNLSVVPEPGSVALLGGALLAVGTVFRRRARRA
jgi:hypothetical protein